jgi:hypothetical protein
LNRRAVRVRIREHERRNLDAARLRHPVRGRRRRARCRRSPGWARHCGTTTPRRPPGERGRPRAWFELSLRLVRSASGFSPPVASRAFAYAGLTLYEAVEPGMCRYRSLERLFDGLDDLPAARGKAYSWPAAANAALASIFGSLIPTAGAAELAAAADLEARFERRFRRALPPGTFRRSVRRGREVAAAVFAWSQGDGGHEGYRRNFPPCSPPVGSGLWVPPRGSSPPFSPSGGRTGASRSPTAPPSRRRSSPVFGGAGLGLSA